MQTTGVIAQLRTTNLAESIRFYTTKLGFTLDFLYDDFYAGIRAGDQLFHLKLVDEKDPSIEFVDEGGHFHLYFQTDDVPAAASALKGNGVRLETDVHETAWQTREFVIKDDQGHTLYFGEPLQIAQRPLHAHTLARGTIWLMLDCPMSSHGREACVSLEVEDTDAYYDEWSPRVEVRRPPKNESWRARTFDVIDPFGNTIFVTGPMR